jgi:hypothetical protein
LGAKYTAEKGFHTVALKKVPYGASITEIPCRLVIGACKFAHDCNTYIVDKFDEKQGLLSLASGALATVKDDDSLKSIIVLTLRLMIEWRYNYSTDKVLNHYDSETVSFFRHYLSYLSQVKMDDFFNWTEEDFKFYNKVNFEISLDKLKGRETLY